MLNLPFNAGKMSTGTTSGSPARASLSTLQLASRTQRLLMDRFVPASVVVNAKHQALYFCGPTEGYLLHPRGAPTTNLLAHVRDGLRARLLSALNEAAKGDKTIVVSDARVRRGTAFMAVKISVIPMSAGEDQEPLLLLVFEDQPASIAAPQTISLDSALIRELEDELRTTKDELQNTIEQLEGSNEELTVANEEVVSTNEELQSLNEELSTVNQQLQSKLTELKASYDNLNNLLASSEIATICLDREFRVKWFAPGIRNVFNLIESDIGRPIKDFTPGLTGSSLVPEAASVLNDQMPLQREFLSENGRWYMRRIAPFLAGRDRIEGIMITFTDISESMQAAKEAIAARASFADAMEEKVLERTEQLRFMAIELAMTEERERRQLAQELHDDLGQILAIISLKLTSLAGDSKAKLSKAAQQQLEVIIRMLDRANKSARTIMVQISPPLLHQLGLVPALERLTEEMGQTHGIKIRFRDDGKPKPLDEATSIILFRSVRELLLNVVKHAGVNLAEVACERNDDTLTIRIKDAGRGFLLPKSQTPDAEQGFGLFSVRERMDYIGGHMQIDSKLGNGSTITLTVPLSAMNEIPKK